jgi:hypothetical protein
MLEVLVLVGLVVTGWLVLQVIRQRRDAAPSPPRPSSLAPLPPQFVREPADLVGGTRVLISHPLVRRAAERAAAQGNRYIALDGDNLYFLLDAIDDDDERRRAHDILSRSLSDDPEGHADLDVQDLLWVARLLGQG